MNRPLCLIITVCSLLPRALLANGFYVPVQAPEATGRGNAWLATADSSAAVYYNAAGLTQLQAPDVSIGAYSVRLGIDAETASGDYSNNASWSLLPQIYAAVPINERLVAGFGINTPFGLSTDWGASTPFSPLAIETELNYVTGWAVAGYKVTDEISIGGGFGLHYADAKFVKTAAFLGDFSRFEGSSEALSWTLSARWQPSEQHAFGVVYRSKADFNLNGDADAIGGVAGEDADLDFITPATLGAGYVYRPCQEWELEANIEWVNWDELNTLTMSKASGNVGIPFNWNSNFIYSVGATRFFDGGWNVSAGYNYIENSQPDATFNPGISDADRHWLNVGCGREWESFKFNLAYQYAFSDRDVSGSPYGLADGSYKSRFHGLMASCEWRF
jgi:long-chain fatty acid transport protein